MQITNKINFCGISKTNSKYLKTKIKSLPNDKIEINKNTGTSKPLMNLDDVIESSRSLKKEIDEVKNQAKALFQVRNKETNTVTLVSDIGNEDEEVQKIFHWDLNNRLIKYEEKYPNEVQNRTFYFGEIKLEKTENQFGEEISQLCINPKGKETTIVAYTDLETLSSHAFLFEEGEFKRYRGLSEEDYTRKFTKGIIWEKDENNRFTQKTF